MTAFSKVRNALTRNGADSPTKILFQLVVIAVVYISFLAGMLAIARAVL